MIAVPVGSRSDGSAVVVPLVETSTLVAGLPGSGKSSTLRAVIAGGAHRPDVALVLIDPKRVELPLWEPRATLVATEPDEIGDALASMVALIDARYRMMQLDRLTSWPVAADRPAVVVVVDELAELVDSGDGADKQRTQHLRRILSKGRAAGVIVIAATQRPSADVVPTSLRDLFALRIAHACATKDATTMILGDAADVGPAHELPIGAEHRGLGYAVLEGERCPVLFRTWWLDPAQARAIAAETAHLRPVLDLGPVPSAFPVAVTYPVEHAQVLDAVGTRPVTAPAVARATGLGDDRVRATLASLAAAGTVRRLNGSQWVRT